MSRISRAAVGSAAGVGSVADSVGKISSSRRISCRGRTSINSNRRISSRGGSSSSRRANFRAKIAESVTTAESGQDRGRISSRIVDSVAAVGSVESVQ